MSDKPQTLSMTHKQVQIMKVICAGNGVDAAGNQLPVDLDELLSRLPYKTTKDSIHFSIRALIRRGMLLKGNIESRRNRMRVTLHPTKLGRDSLSFKVAEKIVEPQGLDDLPVEVLFSPEGIS